MAPTGGRSIIRAFLEAIAIGALLCPPPLWAQADRSAVLVGVGTEVAGTGDGPRFRPGVTAMLGYHAQAPASRLGVRVAGSWFYRSYDAVNPGSAISTLSLVADMTYDLSRGATRPYVLIGGGIARLAGTGYSAVNTTVLSGVVQGGIGLQFRAAGLDLFAESRYSYFSNGSGITPHIVPLGLGVRF